jgi:hypothetical protein
MAHEPQLTAIGPAAVALGSWQSPAHGLGYFVVAKMTFALEPGVCKIANPDPIATKDAFFDDDDKRSVTVAAELCPPKPRVDVLLTGSVFSERPVHRLVAYLGVGPFEKALEVCSDRFVDTNEAVNEGAAFTRMPLTWERAAGGSDTSNPVGRRPERTGAGKLHLPNIQPLATDPAAPDWTVPPIGFGPVAPTWATRTSLLGRNRAPTFDRNVPTLPDDFHYGFFSAAPRDQQIAKLSIDDPIFLEGLHPTHPKLSTRLPGLRPRAVLEPSNATLSLQFDTLHIDTDRQLVTATWRGTFWHREHQPTRILVLVEEAETTASAKFVPQETARLELPDRSKLHALPFSATESKRGSAPPPRPLPRSGTPFGGALGAPPAHATAELGAVPMDFTKQHGETAAFPIATPYAPPPPPPASSAGRRDLVPPPMAPLAGAPMKPPSRTELDHSGREVSSHDLSGARVVSAPAAVTPALSAPVPAPVVPPPLPQPPPVVNIPVAPPPPVVSLPVGPPPIVSGPSAVNAPLGAAPLGGLGSLSNRSSASADVLPSYLKDQQAASGVAQPVAHAPMAGKGGALEASHAAAGVSRETKRPPTTRRTVPPPDSRPKGPLLDLLWFHAEAHLNLPRPPRGADDEWVSKKGSVKSLGNDTERVKVARAMGRSMGLDQTGLKHALAQGATSDGILEELIQAAHGELTLTLDPFELLATTISLAEPHALVDRRLKETIDQAATLKDAHKAVPMQVIDNAVQRIRQAFVSAATRQVSPDYLQTNAERYLAEERRFVKKTVRGESCILGQLTPVGGGQAIPIFLPDAAAGFLPPIPTFDAKVFGRVILQLDGQKLAQIWVMALAAVTG